MINLGILRTVCQPQRSPWREKIKCLRPAYIAPKGYEASTYKPLLSPKIDKSKSQRAIHVVESNLSDNELRFWAGGLKGGNWSCCRCCQTVVYEGLACDVGIPRRKWHQEQGNCTKIIREVYKELLEAEVCAICDVTGVKSQKWGVPLCKEPCMDLWKVRRDGGYYFRESLKEKIANYERAQTIS